MLMYCVWTQKPYIPPVRYGGHSNAVVRMYNKYCFHLLFFQPTHCKTWALLIQHLNCVCIDAVGLIVPPKMVYYHLCSWGFICGAIVSPLSTDLCPTHPPTLPLPSTPTHSTSVQHTHPLYLYPAHPLTHLYPTHPPTLPLPNTSTHSTSVQHIHPLYLCSTHPPTLPLPNTSTHSTSAQHIHPLYLCPAHSPTHSTPI